MVLGRRLRGASMRERKNLRRPEGKSAEKHPKGEDGTPHSLFNREKKKGGVQASSHTRKKKRGFLEEWGKAKMWEAWGSSSGGNST